MGIESLIFATQAMNVAQSASNKAKVAKQINESNLRCRLPDGEVLMALDIRYEKETNNVIVETAETQKWFCLPEDEFHAQMKLLVESGFCDFREHQLITTEQKLKRIKEIMPQEIEEWNRKDLLYNWMIAIGGVVAIALLVGILWYISH